MLWQLKDKNNLTVAQAVFENHPSLLAEFLRLSTWNTVNETESIKNSQASYASKEAMLASAITFDQNKSILTENCKGAISAVFTALMSQDVTAPHKMAIAYGELKSVHELILKTLSTKERYNTQLNHLPGDLRIAGDYETLLQKSYSMALLPHEKGLEGKAWTEERTNSILVHIGCIIEAFKLNRLTQLRGGEDKGYLFDHARNTDNRELYIETVKICLEKWGIKVPQLVHAPKFNLVDYGANNAPNPPYIHPAAVSHIPGPLQSSSSVSSTSSTVLVSPDSSTGLPSPSGRRAGDEGAKILF